MTISWRVEVSYEGYDPTLDDELEKRAGRSRSDSGAGFGHRDMGWTCRNEAEARYIGAQLEAMKHPDLVIEVVGYDDAEED